MSTAAFALTLALAAAGCIQPAKVDPAAPSPVQAPATTPSRPTDPAVDDLLTRLETADKNLSSLSARIVFVKQFSDIQMNERHVRTGDLLFARRKDAAPGAAPATQRDRRTFSITFDSLTVDKRRNEEKKQYVFDGEVLIERDFKLKNFHRQRLVAPGSTEDPLRLGEGRVQFPMPLGQKKADILSRFDAQIVPTMDNVDPSSAHLKEVLKDTVQVRLVPKPGSTQARDFVEIRIWYRTNDLLPVFSQAVNTDGTRAEVLLEDLRPGAPVSDGAFNTSPPDARDGWQGKNDDTVRSERPVSPVSTAPQTPPPADPPKTKPAE